MYGEEDLVQARGQRKARLWVALLPAAVLLAAAVAVFVYGQLRRSDQLWIVTTALTLVAGAYFLFLYGVSVRPMRLYEKHVDCMLHGRKRETVGVFKSFGDQPCDKNGLDCYPLMLNVGDQDAGEDDRLFYYDAHKEKPHIPLGTRVRIVSNDMMIADVRAT